MGKVGTTKSVDNIPRKILTHNLCMYVVYLWDTVQSPQTHAYWYWYRGGKEGLSLSVSTISQIGRLGKKAPLPYGPYSCSCCMSIAVPYLFINIAFHFIHCPLLYGTQFTDKGVNMSPAMIFEQFVSLKINNYSTLNMFSTFLTH